MTEETRTDRAPAVPVPGRAEGARIGDDLGVLAAGPAAPDGPSGRLLRFPPPGRHRRVRRRSWLVRAFPIPPGDDGGWAA